MIKKYSILFLLLITATASCFPQGVKVSASIDSNKIKIADYVKMNVKASFIPKTTLSWPELKDALTENITIINKGKIDTLKNNDSITLSRLYILTSYDSGNFYIPAIEFNYKNSGDTAFSKAYTDSILLNVQTMAVDTSKAIRDIKGPISVPYDERELIPYIISVIIFGLLAWFIVFYIRKRRKGEKLIDFSKPALSPHEVALRALDELKNKKLWQNNKVKEYYTELTEIIRVYIEKRFVVAAMEMTSDEIITAFRSIDITDDLKAKLRQLFILADLVKFAKADPLPNEHDLSFYNAQTFVRDTIPPVAFGNTDAKENTGLDKIKPEDSKNV